MLPSGKAWQRATSINVKAMAPAAHIIAANLHFSHIDHAMGSAIETQMINKLAELRLLCCSFACFACHVNMTLSSPIFFGSFLRTAAA